MLSNLLYPPPLTVFPSFHDEYLNLHPSSQTSRLFHSSIPDQDLVSFYLIENTKAFTRELPLLPAHLPAVYPLPPPVFTHLLLLHSYPSRDAVPLPLTARPSTCELDCGFQLPLQLHLPISPLPAHLFTISLSTRSFSPLKKNAG